MGSHKGIKVMNLNRDNLPLFKLHVQAPQNVNLLLYAASNYEPFSLHFKCPKRLHKHQGIFLCRTVSHLFMQWRRSMQTFGEFFDLPKGKVLINFANYVMTDVCYFTKVLNVRNLKYLATVWLEGCCGCLVLYTRSNSLLIPRYINVRNNSDF